MKLLVVLCTMVVLVVAGTKKQDKRGLFGLGYGYPLGHEGVVSSVTVEKHVAVPVLQPYAVPVEKHVPYPVKVPIAVPVERPYPVAIPKPYPVAVEKPVPYPVERPVPYPVKVPYPVHVPVHIPVAQPVYPVIHSYSGFGHYHHQHY